jgi:dTDP-4-dehydrorhamnose reductase
VKGLYHLAGQECVSKYEFGRQLATQFGLNADLVASVSVDSAGLKAPRSKNLCLDCEGIGEVIDIKLLSLQAGLDRFHRQQDDGTHKELKQFLKHADAI